MARPRRTDSLSNLPVNLMAGGSDGLLISFILTAALFHFGLSTGQIVWINLGYGLWASFAIGWAGYVASRGEAHHYGESQVGLFRDIGLGPDVIDQMAVDEASDRVQWRQYQKDLGLPIERPTPRHAWRQGMQMGFSYLLGMVFMISPYVFLSGPRAYHLGLVFGFILVAALGLFRGVYTGRSLLWEAGRMVAMAAMGILLIHSLSFLLQSF